MSHDELSMILFSGKNHKLPKQQLFSHRLWKVVDLRNMNMSSCLFQAKMK